MQTHLIGAICLALHEQGVELITQEQFNAIVAAANLIVEACDPAQQEKLED